MLIKLCEHMRCSSPNVWTKANAISRARIASYLSLIDVTILVKINGLRYRRILSVLKSGLEQFSSE
jgi:ABC-type phosphate transport system auxiliary subunit